MKINAIIGAGQLGSRHLQGLLKLEIEQTIYVIDPSVDSLNLSENRSKEIIHSHKIYFFESIDSVPSKIDLAIIATGADVRESVIANLLEKSSVSYLILEKVLFQDIDAYNRISKLLKQSKTKTWVNHSRRMMPHYQELQKKMINEHSPFHFNLIGNNWGLGCNALHFIDLFCFLAQTELFEIESNWIDDEIQLSKRNGFIEFTGTLKGRFHDGSLFLISSINTPPSGVMISCMSANNCWIINENGRSQINQISSSNSTDLITSEIKMMYQSELTTIMAKNLFENGTVSLPTFEESKNIHLLFIKSLICKRNSITNEESNILNIT